MSRLSVGLADFGSQALSLGMVCYTTVNNWDTSQTFHFSTSLYFSIYPSNMIRLSCAKHRAGPWRYRGEKGRALLFQSLSCSQEEIDSKALNKNMNKVTSILMKCSEENEIGQWKPSWEDAPGGLWMVEGPNKPSSQQRAYQAGAQPGQSPWGRKEHWHAGGTQRLACLKHADQSGWGPGCGPKGWQRSDHTGPWSWWGTQISIRGNGKTLEQRSPLEVKWEQHMQFLIF